MLLRVPQLGLLVQEAPVPRPGDRHLRQRRGVEKIFVDVKNIWTDHAADDAKHDGSQPQEHKLRVGPALNIKLQTSKYEVFQLYISYLLEDVFRQK